MYKKYIFLSAIMLINKLILCQTPVNDSHWNQNPIYFSEDFTTYPDTINTWLVKNHYCHPWPNTGCEPQVYTNRLSNVHVSSGKLVLTARKEDYYTLNQWFHYTSGYIEFRNPFQYGYLEAMIKFPYGYGLWPSFWVWSPGQHYPAGKYNEIDISEINIPETVDQNHLNTNYHAHYFTDANDDPGPECGPSFDTYMNDYTQYHRSEERRVGNE